MWRQSSLLICPLLLVSTYATEGDKDYSNREAMLLTIQYGIGLGILVISLVSAV